VNGTVDFASFGIIGFGHFGQFMAESFRPYGDVIAYDVESSRLPTDLDGVRSGSLAEVANADVVIVAVPYAALVDVLAALRAVLPPSTLVVDVVSTKAQSTALLREILGSHGELLATHPLFGPPSMERMEPGNRIVVTYSHGERAKGFERFLEQQFGLDVMHVDADAHDRAMAYMQALPFFIARALVDLDFPELTEPHGLQLPSFEKLMAIAAIEQHHTPEMFDTSQRSNPYAEQARQELLDALRKLHDQLELAAINDPLPIPGQLELPDIPQPSRG
jgi:prephenate dehydrogenase